MKPKYQIIIIDDIKSYILSGDVQQGRENPYRIRFAGNYNVSRQTVRKAILELSNEGFLRSEKGSGTYVSNQYRSRSGGKPIIKRLVSLRPISRITSFPPLSAALKAD